MKSSQEPAEVLLIDDHPAVRSALRVAIEQNPAYRCCGEADSAASALSALRSLEPDVAIVDLSLRDAHGLDLIRDIRAQHPEVRIVTYSMFSEESFAERAIRAGALAYVDKADPTATVLEAIDAAMRGDVYVSRRTASRILRRLVKNDTERHHDRINALTDREMVVFQMLGQGLLIDEIADRLKLSRKTIEAYRRGAKEKLGFDTVTELVCHGHEWLTKHV